jgi:hypothetical protein
MTKIYDKEKMKVRTNIQQLNTLFQMGSELEDKFDHSIITDIDDHLDKDSTNPVMNKVIVDALNHKMSQLIPGKGIRLIDNVISVDDNIFEPDSALSETSTNSVQNRVITEKLKQKFPLNDDYAQPFELGTGLYWSEGLLYANGVDVHIDQELDETSTNAIANKPVALAIKDKQDKIRSGVQIATIQGKDITGDEEHPAGNIDIIDIDTEFDLGSSDPLANYVIAEAIGNIKVQKQDRLISEDNIAAIRSGGVTYNLLDGGIVDIVADVQVDDQMSDVSTHAVQNKTIKAYVDAVPHITVDSQLSSTSENPVQNKVIYNNLQNKADKSPELRKILVGTTEVPDPSLGSDGDIYIYKPL